jgi:hypothetical protein
MSVAMSLRLKHVVSLPPATAKRRVRARIRGPIRAIPPYTVMGRRCNRRIRGVNPCPYLVARTFPDRAAPTSATNTEGTLGSTGLPNTPSRVAKRSRKLACIPVLSAMPSVRSAGRIFGKLSACPRGTPTGLSGRHSFPFGRWDQHNGYSRE